MLSTQSRQLLRWFEKNDTLMTEQEVKNSCKRFDERSFQTLKTERYIESKPDTTDIWLKRYRISDAGKAYLEGAKLEKKSRFREWLALILSIIALLVSFIPE